MAIVTGFKGRFKMIIKINGKLENIKVNDNPQEMLENIEKYLEV